MSVAFAPVKQELVASTLLLAIAIAFGCRTVPLQDVVDAPLPAACSAATPDEVDEAIWRAGRKAGWAIDRVEPGVLLGTWSFRQHAAMVSITQRNGHLSIRYVWSRNLLYEGDRIHRAYQKLLVQLLAAIQHEPVGEAPGRC